MEHYRNHAAYRYQVIVHLADEKAAIAKAMLEKGFDTGTIMSLTGLSAEEIRGHQETE